MNILYIGDIMGQSGVDVVRRVLPELKKQHHIDLVIAQAENVTEGKGLSPDDFKLLRDMGIDFFSGGNWSTHRSELNGHLNDPNQPVIRPANYPDDVAGLGAKSVQTAKGLVLVVSLLGQIVGKDADKPVYNPLTTIDRILEETKHVKYSAKVVNFHGDYSSEKLVIGHYLDGRVSAVIGDHWHIPTADAMVLPKGTAHITDVGMCGSLHSSLGIKLDSIISRWHDGTKNRNELETKGTMQFNAVLVDVAENGLAKTILPIRQILD